MKQKSENIARHFLFVVISFFRRHFFCFHLVLFFPKNHFYIFTGRLIFSLKHVYYDVSCMLKSMKYARRKQNKIPNQMTMKNSIFFVASYIFLFAFSLTFSFLCEFVDVLFYLIFLFCVLCVLCARVCVASLFHSITCVSHFCDE